MKVYSSTHNVYDAVDAVVEHGVAVLSGTKTPAVDYGNRVIEHLSAYPEISPTISYQNVPSNGYFYYVVDLNRFSTGDKELNIIILDVDSRDK